MDWNLDGELGGSTLGEVDFASSESLESSMILAWDGRLFEK